VSDIELAPEDLSTAVWEWAGHLSMQDNGRWKTRIAHESYSAGAFVFVLPWRYD
jgi:hypothetical protein